MTGGQRDARSRSVTTIASTAVLVDAFDLDQELAIGRRSISGRERQA
jgi:hypothetical protein